MTTAATRLSRRALPVLVVAGFVQPACFTATTWRDDRSAESLARVEPPLLEAFRARDGDGADVLLRVPAKVRGLLPGVPSTSEWVVVRPSIHRGTVATLVACCAVRWELARPLWIDLVEELDGSRSVLLRSSSWRTGGGAPALAPLDGFSRGTSVYPLYSFEVPCALLPLAAEPAVGERLVAFHLACERRRDDGTPLLGRIALTPLAVAGDALLAPLELLWWLGL